MPIAALWPIIQWLLRAMGVISPEDKAKEEEFRLKFLEAAAQKDMALMKAWADFQALWHPPAERVAVWANTVIALYQPVLLTLLYIDIVAFQARHATGAIANLIPPSLGPTPQALAGLLILGVALMPFFGPALLSGIASAFSAAVQAIFSNVKKDAGGSPQPPTPDGNGDGQDGRR